MGSDGAVVQWCAARGICSARAAALLRVFERRVRGRGVPRVEVRPRRNERVYAVDHGRCQRDLEARAAALRPARSDSRAVERTALDVLAVFERRYLPTVRRTTEELWRTVIARHLVPLIGAVPLSALSRERIFEMGAEALASGRSVHIVKHTMTVLRRALRWYWIEHEIETRCPADLVTPAWSALRVREHLKFGRREAWSRAEAEIVLEEAWKLGGPIYPLLLLGLEWRDVD